MTLTEESADRYDDRRGRFGGVGGEQQALSVIPATFAGTLTRRTIIPIRPCDCSRRYVARWPRRHLPRTRG